MRITDILERKNDVGNLYFRPNRFEREGRYIMYDVKTAFAAGLIVSLAIIALMIFLAQGLRDGVAESCDEQGYFISHGTIYECQRRMIGGKAN